VWPHPENDSDEPTLPMGPRGTREAALKRIDKPAIAACRILRDAYNRGQAIAMLATVESTC
jgi:hypothetical protein